ncbi:MAG: winged helix-turn-helix transcriptional regulator [Bacteroidales bacterium]|nr:winged helix-turn-helix transcriptional regulator [Bacteroidales bacterium]
MPPRVEYRLTERGLSCFPVIDNQIGWAAANMEQIISDREARMAGEKTPI